MGLLAVWTVGDSDGGPGPLRRQATAIRAFVEHAAGEQEANERLIKALNRPG